jgi:prepilin signal peptidase PulO-like enzyme (type II secretory pathway)
MSDFKSKVKGYAFLTVLYIVMLCIFPFQVFITTGIAYLIYNFFKIFGRKSFIDNTHNMMNNMLTRLEKGDPESSTEAVFLILKPYKSIVFYAFIGLFFFLMALFTGSGFLALIILLVMTISSKFIRRRQKHETVDPPEGFTSEELKEFWNDDDFQEGREGFGRLMYMTQPMVWFRTSILGLLYVIPILANELYFHYDTWSWIGF